RSSTLPARAGERLPAWWCPAREGARSPRALQTRDIGRREASPIVQTSLVACRLPSGTILFRQPAAHRLRSQQPHSPCRPRWLPRTVAAHLGLPLAVDLGTAMAPSGIDPTAAFEWSSQPPSSWCCDNRLNPPTRQARVAFAQEPGRNNPRPPPTRNSGECWSKPQECANVGTGV